MPIAGKSQLSLDLHIQHKRVGGLIDAGGAPFSAHGGGDGMIGADTQRYLRSASAEQLRAEQSTERDAEGLDGGVLQLLQHTLRYPDAQSVDLCGIGFQLQGGALAVRLQPDQPVGNSGIGQAVGDGFVDAARDLRFCAVFAVSFNDRLQSFLCHPQAQQQEQA